MKPESKDERMLKKTCFFARHGRNNAGYECNVQIVSCGETIELTRPARQMSPSVHQPDPKAPKYTSTVPAYVLTDRFNSVIFGTPESVQELGLAWYSTIPAYEELTLLRSAETYYMQDRRAQTGFLNWLIQGRQLVMLAHMLEMSTDQLLRAKERSQIYYAARNRSPNDYRMMIASAEGAAEQAAARLRAQVASLAQEEHKVEVQKALLAKAPEEMAKLQARTKYAVPDLVGDAQRDLTRREETRARLAKSVETLRRELQYQMTRLEHLKEFQPLVGSVKVEAHG